MATFPFAVHAPERTAFDGPAAEVSLRTEGGDIGFLAGHVPFIGEVEPSVCAISLEDGSRQLLAVHGGFVEVDPEGVVTLLADRVETAEEIDVARAREARERAAGADDAAALRRAEVRLEVAGEHSGGH